MSTSIFLVGCSALEGLALRSSIETSDSLQACPVTQPLWAKPPDDPAVRGEAGFGYFFVNEDSSMWASAWWEESEDSHLIVGDEGNIEWILW